MKIKNYFKNKLGRGLHILNGFSASLILLSAIEVNAQSSSGLIKSNSHIGGYHVKCNGESTGTLEAIPNFGQEPYTFQWSTGETTSIITNKPAGLYYVSVIDANNTAVTDTFELKEPRLLSIEQKTSDYSGYGVSSALNNDGYVELIANGGTPPYEFHWNNGETTSIIKNLTAGEYEYLITDANHCNTNGIVTITSPTAVQISFSNVQATSCFEKNDGKATLNVSGGLGEYSVMWKNGNFSFNPEDLEGGFNAVRIFQKGKTLLDTGIFIPTANQIDVQFNLSNYNGYNVSCADCYNGNVTTIVSGGTAPYTYLWDDENQSTSGNLSSLNGGVYNLLVIDAQGCKSNQTVKLSMPAAKDWSRNGNSTIDSTQFIGSTDNSAVVFKSNNNVAIYIQNDTINFDAQIRMMNLDSTQIGSNNRVLGIDENGIMKVIQIDAPNPGLPIPGYSCDGCGCSPKLAWGAPTSVVSGVSTPLNTMDIVKCPSDGNVGIGVSIPEANTKLDIYGEIAISGSRLNVGYNGNVGIGTSTPNEKFHLHGGNLKVTCPWDYTNPVFFVDHANKTAGIGTGAPRGKFEIQIDGSDDITFGNMRTEASGWATSYMAFNAYRHDGGLWNTTNDGANAGGAVIYSNAIGDLMFTTLNGEGSVDVMTSDAGIKGNTKMTITNDGRVGIGVNPKNHVDLFNYRLVVDGNIKCKKLRVDVQNWGDFVFDTNYSLMDLNSIAQYIDANKHLPGMPSASEIEKEGIDLGEMVKLQQVKIEELTLLLIKMQKQIDQTEKKN